MHKHLSCARSALAIRWNDRRNFTKLSHYLSLAIPSCLILVSEWFSGDIMTILSGQISKIDQTAIIIQFNISVIVRTSAIGLGTAACTLVGQQLGNNNVSMAKKYAVAASIAAILSTLIECSIISLNYETLIKFLSNDAAVQAITRNTLTLSLLFQALDKLQTVMWGVVRGLG